MKARELLALLQNVNPDCEVHLRPSKDPQAQQPAHAFFVAGSELNESVVLLVPETLKDVPLVHTQ